MLKILLMVLIGFLGGIPAGMGMGGGTFLIPLLTHFCDFSQHEAQAINLVSFFPMAIVALILHAKNKLLKFEGILWLIIPATLASVVAAILAKGVKEEVLSVCFGGFLTLLGVITLVVAIVGIVKSKKQKKEQEQDEP